MSHPARVLCSSSVIGLFLALVSGCPQPNTDQVSALVQEVFLRPIEGPGELLQGYQRWAWLAGPPSADGSMEVVCTSWESLYGERVDPPAVCETCQEAWLFEAEPFDDDCGGVPGSPRVFSLGLSLIADAPAVLAEYEEDGYRFAVWSTQSPELGAGTWRPLFAAQPWQWSGMQDTAPSSTGDGLASGEWALWSPYYWDVSGFSTTATDSE